MEFIFILVVVFVFLSLRIFSKYAFNLFKIPTKAKGSRREDFRYINLSTQYAKGKVRNQENKVEMIVSNYSRLNNNNTKSIR